MSLFGTKKANKVSDAQVVEMLSEYYKRRGLDIEGHEVDSCRGYGWWITEGSAKIYIFIQDDKVGTLLRVSSPIVHFPNQDKERFFLKLLEINRDLSQCCLAASDDLVIVSGQRPILGLDQEELNTLIWNVSYVADTLDDQLAEEFGAALYTEE